MRFAIKELNQLIASSAFFVLIASFCFRRRLVGQSVLADVCGPGAALRAGSAVTDGQGVRAAIAGANVLVAAQLLANHAAAVRPLVGRAARVRRFGN